MVKEAGVVIKACSHITGGGFYENIPRMLPETKKAKLSKNSYPIPAIFKLLQEKGGISEEMMYSTYNMGIGMMIAVNPADVEKALTAIKDAGEEAYVIGAIEEGQKDIELC